MAGTTAEAAQSERIAVLGLGYVGLPLALAFDRAGLDTLGLDLNAELVDALNSGHDPNNEVSDQSLKNGGARFTTDPQDLTGRSVFILAVPTPITDAKAPDLDPLRNACATIAPFLSKGALVIVESTVYPGVTEEVCGPLLAEQSGLRLYEDFQMAYSPERVNPGDAEHSLENVTKIISAQDAKTLDRVENLYARIVHAGLHRAASIMTAEAAKVIENTQRDLNIALVNEFSLIFSRLGLDTLDVLEAAGTKWNFLPFRPGLVGGHCIGVDPYYLTYRAEKAGYHPEVILAGRRINDGMGLHVARELVKALLANNINLPNARVLVLGFAFKENCTDIRNTRVADIVSELESFSLQVDVHDPWVDAKAMQAEYGRAPIAEPGEMAYDAIIVAVAHREFKTMGSAAIRALGKPGAVVYDIKGVLGRTGADLRL